MDNKRKEEIVNLLTKNHTDFVTDIYEPFKEDKQELLKAIKDIQELIDNEENSIYLDVVKSLETEFNMRFDDYNRRELGELIVKISLNHK